MFSVMSVCLEGGGWSGPIALCDKTTHPHFQPPVAWITSWDSIPST